jgi:hypothetical protein
MLIATLPIVLPALLRAQTANAAKTDAELLVLGHKMYDWYVAGEADSILAYMSADARQGAGGTNGVLQSVGRFLARAGVENEMVEEKMTRRRGLQQYWREGVYSTFTDEPLVFRWVFDEHGDAVGIGTGPKSQTPAPD